VFQSDTEAFAALGFKVGIAEDAQRDGGKGEIVVRIGTAQIRRGKALAVVRLEAGVVRQSKYNTGPGADLTGVVGVIVEARAQRDNQAIIQQVTAMLDQRPTVFHRVVVLQGAVSSPPEMLLAVIGTEGENMVCRPLPGTAQVHNVVGMLFFPAQVQ